MLCVSIFTFTNKQVGLSKHSSFRVLRAFRDSDNQIMELTQEKHKTRCLWLENYQNIFLIFMKFVLLCSNLS